HSPWFLFRVCLTHLCPPSRGQQKPLTMLTWRHVSDTLLAVTLPNYLLRRVRFWPWPQPYDEPPLQVVDAPQASATLRQSHAGSASTLYGSSPRDRSVEVALQATHAALRAQA